ncbi:MAG: hypothetical protein DMG92_11340 [Acidobacteria bacterium]|nr:MAG: hypothetical protein DMG92_11340 [Acidobacteriota bacterium]
MPVCARALSKSAHTRIRCQAFWIGAQSCLSFIPQGGTLKEIAANCCYSDPAYFCRVFRKICKLTPTEYRAQSAGAGSRVRVSGILVSENKYRKHSGTANQKRLATSNKRFISPI